MGELSSQCDPLPTQLLDIVLQQLTPASLEQNANGAKLAIQLLNRFASIFEKPVRNFLENAFVRKEKGQCQCRSMSLPSSARLRYS